MCHVSGRGFPLDVFFTGLVGEWSHIHVCPSNHIVETVWFMKRDSVQSCLNPSVFLIFNQQHNCRSQCCELGARRTKLERKRNQNSLLLCGEASQALSSGAKQAPCESQPFSTLDGDELQLCDERFTCHLQIHAWLLPMKQIAGKSTTPPQSPTTALSPLNSSHCCT